MSKTKGALFSLSAQKTLGKSITFVNSKGYKAVRSHFKPNQPNSPPQMFTRSVFSYLNDLWIHPFFPELNRRSWDYKAKIINPQAHGRNMMIQRYMIPPHPSVFGTPSLFPPAVVPGLISITVLAGPVVSVNFHIVRGENAGYDENQPSNFPGVNVFGPFTQSKLSICQIKFVDPNMGGWTGYFNLDPNWWA